MWSLVDVENSQCYKGQEEFTYYIESYYLKWEKLVAPSKLEEQMLEAPSLTSPQGSLLKCILMNIVDILNAPHVVVDPYDSTTIRA